MGQTVGRLPNKWDCLLDEKDRVLYWSAEILSKVANSVNREESFLVDYNDESIDKKIEAWMDSNIARVDRIFSKHPNLSETYKIGITNELERIREAFRIRMRNDYHQAYKDIRKLTKRIDELSEQQRKIHAKIQNLEKVHRGNMKKFQKKFGLLRLKTYKNLGLIEKMMFQDKKLKAHSIRRVYDIDHKNVQDCAKCVDKLIKYIEKTALK